MAFVDLLVKLSADITGLEKGVNAAVRKIENLGSQVSAMGARLSVAISAPLAAVGLSALKVAGDLEQNTIAFTTMTGSAVVAQQHLDELKKFALSTPFEFTDLTLASKRLQALGFSATSVIPTLTAVGNAASALGSGAEGIQRITTALGQMQAKGKVQAEEMRQLAEAGIPAWQILAKTLNTTVAGAMKLVEQRAVDASVAVPALLAGMNAKFGGLMEKQATSLLGMWSNVKDALGFALADIGKLIAPFAKDFITNGLQPALNKIKEMTAAFTEMNPKLQTLTLGFAGAAIAAPPLIWGLGQIVGGVMGAYRALTALIPLLVSPAGLAVAFGTVLVGAISAGIYKLHENNIALDKAWETLEQGRKGINRWSQEWSKSVGAAVSASYQLVTVTNMANGVLKESEPAAKVATLAQLLLMEAHQRGQQAIKKSVDTLYEWMNAGKAYGAKLIELQIPAQNFAADLNQITLVSPGTAAAIASLAGQFDGMKAGLTAAAVGIGLVSVSTEELQKRLHEFEGDAAFERLGIKSSAALAKLADQAVQDYDEIATNATSTAVDIQRAWVVMVGRQIDAGKVFTQEELNNYERIKTSVGSATKSVDSAWKTMGREVTTIMNDLGRGIAQAIVQFKSLGDVFKKVAQDIAEAILRVIIMKGFQKLMNVLADVHGLIGKIAQAMGGVSAAARQIGSNVPPVQVPTTGLPPTGNIPNIGGSVPTGGTAGAGGAAGAVTNSLTGWISAISGAVTAVSSIVGNFQMAGMNASLGLIEKSTRYSEAYLFNLNTSALTYWPQIADRTLGTWGAIIDVGNKIGSRGDTFNITINGGGSLTKQDVRDSLSLMVRELKAGSSAFAT